MTRTSTRKPGFIGFRFRPDERDVLPIQATSIPWNNFASVFIDYYWSKPRPEATEEQDDMDQLLEDEFSGDGSELQLATGQDLNAEATMAEGLLVEVCYLPREVLESRLSGLASLGHTMYNHGPESLEWRLIIPYARPVPVKMANELHKKFFEEVMVGGSIHNDDDQSRWFTRPGCRDDLREFFDHFKVDGNFLDVEAVLSGVQNWDGTPTAPILPFSTVPKAPAIISPPVAHLSDLDLRSELEAVNASMTTPEDFSIVVEQILKLEFEMNHRQKLAPAYRPTFPIPQRTADIKPAHALIQQTRVLIDCHWLHTRCKTKHAVKEAQWAPLMDPTKPFPRELAQQFAERKIIGSIRADEILCLSPLQQAQMRSLCGSEILTKRNSNGAGARSSPSPLAQALRVINQWAASDPRLRADKYEAMARALVMLDGSKTTNTEVGVLVGLILSEAAVRENQVRDMKKRLAEAVRRYS